jgi:photosystem II stability/assembly factor-like uncharacterized protein
MKTALFFIFLLLISHFTFSQWTRTNGPEGISMASLLTVGDTLYAGTETDGVYASTDDGVNWFPMNSGIETMGIGALAYKSGYLFAGTRGNGVYRSSNGGQTWLPPSNENNLYINTMVVKDSSVFAACHGIYRSTDNGVTWVYVGYNTDTYYGLCADGNKLFASDSHYCYITTDDGATWTTLNIYNVWSYYCDGNLVVAGGVSKVFVSTDGGNNFTAINFPINYSIVNLYTIIAMGNELFAATSYDGVYKSTDMGFNWAPVKEGMGPKDVRTLTVTGSSSLIAGAHYAGVYRSTNSGLNWSRSMAGFPAGSTISGLFASGSAILAGTYDGVYRSTNNGLNWNKLIGNKDTVNYAHVRGLWENGDTIFAATIYQFHSTIYKSTDNGVTWEWSGNGISSTERFINVLIKSGNNLLAGTDHGVYYSSDNGNNWIPTNLTDYILGLTRGGGYVYASADYDVYRSSDDGVNWIHAVGGSDFTSIGARDNYACVGTFEGGAVTTTDNGALWFGAGGIPGGKSVYSVFYVPGQNSMVLASTNINGSRIFTSYNNGLSFSPYSDGLGPNAIAELFTATDSFLVAGTDYNGVWRRLRPDIVTSISNNNDVPRTFELEQNYPNPFNPGTKINYSIPKAGFVSLKIYDMLGSEVAVLVDEVKQAREYSVVWNAGKFASGIYFYKLTSGQFTSTKKMILIK